MQLVRRDIIRDVAVTWMRSPWMKDEIAKYYPGEGLRFTKFEAESFADYLDFVVRLGIRTHGIYKSQHTLIGKLALAEGMVVPGARLRKVPHTYRRQGIHLLDAQRQLGFATMESIVREVERERDSIGRRTYYVANAAHFGIGSYWALRLADLGFETTIWATAGTGNQVIPFGGVKATTGTNPITWAFPSKDVNGLPFHVCLDTSTSIMSYGKLSVLKQDGTRVPPGVATDMNGIETEDPVQAFLLHQESHKMLGLSLRIEALAGMLGGGPPLQRGQRQPNAPGGTAQWVIEILNPELFAEVCVDPVGTAVDWIRSVIDDNGEARYPGESALRIANGDKVSLEQPEVDALLEMAEQAGLKREKLSIG